VLRDNAGHGLIWRGVLGSSRVVVLAFGLDSGNLARRPALPVLVSNSVAAVLPPPLPNQIAAGEAVSLPSAESVPSLTLINPAGAKHNFGSERPSSFDDTSLPGLYMLEGRTTTGELWRAGFGVNTGSATESDLRSSGGATLAASGPNAPAPLGEQLPPLDLWPVLAGIVLVVLLIEARLAWR
jgi:hypothetical protein